MPYLRFILLHLVTFCCTLLHPCYIVILLIYNKIEENVTEESKKLCSQNFRVFGSVGRLSAKMILIFFY